ncbi:hypothetical protein VB774_20600 [Pseudanabaena galeata UHCC 0370]|jgi:hypothetical protein|uniref:CAB/ELIP/HLIP superfamily protein n=1 Tax=Pseudanabaena galeata UHCC 0370 TaxID=3110310 RepID=A0ABU5TPR3_9CYAN|nr:MULTISPECIES: hypothetical protein [Pseudanabaena]MEA5480036.1 hypothetical protein [Pseudanabaena galeata UHCC 0370]MEA5486787.1 hypothetical protein [Pseudanabaena sp. CCNP1317]WGS74792.1 hypothetical protein OA858_22610 [Pseudanabaena galeata CCNP1313]
MSPIFSPNFNNFENISQSQAWSLFFAFGRNSSLLGSGRSNGRLFTLALTATVVASVVEVLILSI